MRPARPTTGWLAGGFPAPFNKGILKCSANIRDEILASVDMYAEIKDAGKELLKTNGHQDLSKAYLRFQAYIRQAKAFYEAAETLHPRAAPLNYYYSFMNFAKALIFLRTPTFVDHNLHHGISPKATNGSLQKQKLQINYDGVFPRFYALVADKKISSGSKLKITELIGYCSDVEYEFARLKYGQPVWFNCRLVVGVHKDQKQAFPIIAILNGKHPGFEKLRNSLEKNFEEIQIDVQEVRNKFGMLVEETVSTRFFESKKVWPSQTTKDILIGEIASQLSGLISFVPFNDDRLFIINRTIKTPKAVPMNEIIAIYCCMFFFGSLVRYRPELLEAMLSTKDAWLIERFTKSAPLTFLRLIRNLFDNQYLAFGAR